MKIAQDTVVFIDYILNDGDGNLLEKSDREENFAYLHGYGQLPTKLEEALEGKEAGARVQVSLRGFRRPGRETDNIRSP